MTNKIKLFLIILIFSAAVLYARNNNQIPFDIDARFSFSTNDEITYSDQYQLKAELEFQFPVTEDFECELELEADKYEIDVEEVFFRFKRNRYDILAGKYSNAILLSNILKSNEHPLAFGSATDRLLVDMSYINHAIGAGIKADEINYFYFNIQSIEAQFFEPQFNGGYLYRFSNDIWAGLTGCYFPFFIKDSYIGDYDDVENNFLINAVSYKHEGFLVFGSEVTFGKNIEDPIGLLNSGVNSDREYFLGCDFYGGARVFMNKTELIPLLRTSVLFPDTADMKCSLIETSFNNKIGFSENIRLDFAAGLQILTEYDYKKDLITSLDPLWNVSFKVFI